MKVDERVDDLRPWKKRVLLDPTKKLCSCGADFSSLSVYHVSKHLAGSNHLKVQAASGLRAPTSTTRTQLWCSALTSSAQYRCWISPLYCHGEPWEEVSDGPLFSRHLGQATSQVLNECLRLWTQNSGRLDGHWGECMWWIKVFIFGSLPLLCRRCHSSCLSGGTGWIRQGKGVRRSYVPVPTFPWDYNDAVRPLSVCTVEARWFQAGWYFGQGECSVDYIIQSGMAVVVTFTPPTAEPMCGETVHITSTMVAGMGLHKGAPRRRPTAVLKVWRKASWVEKNWSLSPILFSMLILDVRISEMDDRSPIDDPNMVAFAGSTIWFMPVQM